MTTTRFSQLLRRKEITPQARYGAAAPALTIRVAVPEDADALVRLAALDSNRPPRGLVLIAEVEGEPWAALSLDDGHAVADPFRLSGDLVWMLAQRARGLRRRERSRLHALPRVWPAAVGVDGLPAA